MHASVEGAPRCRRATRSDARHEARAGHGAGAGHGTIRDTRHCAGTGHRVVRAPREVGAAGAGVQTLAQSGRLSARHIQTSMIKPNALMHQLRLTIVEFT
jgi:hypothetical protein